MEQRFSIDTFYFGLRIGALEVQHLLEFINYYLFYFTLEKIQYNFSKNRFYCCSFEDKEHGINIFFRPRKNVKNDYISFELNGKFFRDIVVSKSFVEFILETFETKVNIQRIDIAIDCIYSNSEEPKLCEKTHLLGFPFPKYSENWRYQRLPFEMYGRLINNSFFINMVFQGKNDVRLRVYDKQLDLMDKYDTCYSKYYMLDIEDKLVYRIELQLRGDKVKNYFLQFCCDDIPITYLNLVSSLVNYIFEKYEFDGISNDFSLGKIRSFSTYVKRVPDMLKRIDFYRKQMFSFYNKYIDSYDEYYKFKDLKVISNEFKKSLEKEDFSNDFSKPAGFGPEDNKVGQFYFDFYYEKIKGVNGYEKKND